MLYDILHFRLFTLSHDAFTVQHLLKLLGIIVGFVVGLRLFSKFVLKGLLLRNVEDKGIRHAIATLFSYFAFLVAGIVAVYASGIDLSAMTVVLGTLGVGIGFGLQNIVGNFISGIIILFERPIKVGDRIEVGSITGEVIKIAPRATTVITADNISIIIPNSEFVENRVVNWSLADKVVRLRIPIPVSYKSNTELVEKLILEVAAENDDVLHDPDPIVRLIQFGESSLNYELRVWVPTEAYRQGRVIGGINSAVLKKFRSHGVEIPYPQRDLHIINPVTLTNPQSGR